MPEPMKICLACQRTLPLGEFHKQGDGRPNRHPRCRTCRAIGHQLMIPKPNPTFIDQLADVLAEELPQPPKEVTNG